MNIHLKNYKSGNFNSNGSKPSAIRSLANESGAAMIVALLLMVVMITLIPAAIQLTSGEFQRTADFTDNREAFFIADAGIEHAKSIFAANTIDDVLNGTDEDVTTFTDNGTFTAGGTGPTVIAGSTAVNTTSKIDNAAHDYTQVAYNGNGTGGNYLIRVWDNDDAALCPKDSGGTFLCTTVNTDPKLNTANEAWVDRDGFVNVESIGTTANGVTTTIHAKIKRKIFPPSSFPAAVTLTGPASIISASGGGFVVNGGAPGGSAYGIGDPPTTDPSCPAQEAVATESGDGSPPEQVGNNNEGSCTQPSCMAASTGTYSNFVGASGNSPSVETGQTSFTGVEGEELRTELIPQASVVYNGSQIITGATFGTLVAPQITYFDDNLKLNGSSTGHGVLIVDGNLDISGSLDFNGVILIGACSTCTCPDCPGALVGTGSAKVYGAMVVGNAVNANVNFTGSADIYYSCAAIDLANSIINLNYENVAWKEID
jgi:hypothetical protein